MIFIPHINAFEQWHYQDSISECLHHHSRSSMLSSGIFKAYCAQILLCFGPGPNAWFTI
jgi:hypothetical protein